MIVNNIFITLCIIIVLTVSCNHTSNIDSHLLIGSWEDQSESALHFSLFSDGTAQSDNMKTLLYKKWELKNNLLYLVAESIGNRVSSVDTMVYEIQQLDENRLILKQDDLISTYKKH